MTGAIDTILQGTLLGGLYALFAAGLSLIFGVMRLVNIAHGDLIVLAAYTAFLAVQLTGIDPLSSLIIVVPVMFVIGYALQRGLLNATLGRGILPPLLVTFGLSIIIQNALLQGFSADSRKLLLGPFETASIPLGPDLAIGWFPLLIFATAVVVIAALQALLHRTRIGRAFRAVSDDPETARLYGVDHRHLFAMAMGVALAVVSFAGVFLAIRTNFDPAIGPARLLFAFEAVIIGGLGSLWGTLAGGVILGIAQTVGAKIDPAWQLLAGHIAFLLVLIFRPRGLFPRAVD
ncbi:branched-chain amino acid ABC transporter permease [Desertibaculum subflavum]|uniref:branched-chain amino acid ABC transporter permease n=1 Tax=Desertibaculum subflavum TaxID=2268458 RepID=UPI000E66DFF8